MAINKNLELDLAFKALGDGTRRAIVQALCKEPEIAANSLTNLFDSAQPTISKHLKTLERAGLIIRRIEGRQHYFSLNLNGIKTVEDWTNRHNKLWSTSLDRLGEYLDDRYPKEDE